MGVTNLISDGSVLPKYASDLALTITESKTEVAKWNSPHTDVINLGFFYCDLSKYLLRRAIGTNYWWQFKMLLGKQTNKVNPLRVLPFKKYKAPELSSVPMCSVKSKTIHRKVKMFPNEENKEIRFQSETLCSCCEQVWHELMGN